MMSGGTIVGVFTEGDFITVASGTIGSVDMTIANNVFNMSGGTPARREDFVRLQEHGAVVFTAAVDGALYARRCTAIETRLTVIDKRAAADPAAFPPQPVPLRMPSRCSAGS